MFKLAVFNIHHLNSNWEDFFAFIFFVCLKLQERWIRIKCAHIGKSYLKFRHAPELNHSVHQGINLPASYFLPSLLEIVQAPLFKAIPHIHRFFCELHSPKTCWTSIILTFFIFNPVLSLKETKLLVKIFQFKFLVMADKNFGLQIFCCCLKFQILVYFLCNNCNPSHILLQNFTPSFPGASF